MSRVTLGVLLCLLCLAGQALAQDAAPAEALQAARQQRDHFAALDKDGNGTICQEEYMAVMKERAEKAWKRLDPQGKGCLTREDYDNLRQKMRERKVMRQQAQPQ